MKNGVIEKRLSYPPFKPKNFGLCVYGKLSSNGQFIKKINKFPDIFLVRMPLG